MAQSYATSGPISKLDQDSLETIFLLNADIFDDADAPKNTVRASHVCSAWRHLLLQRPVVWGRLIDLHELTKSGSYLWLAEILRRSGDALLWVRSEIRTNNRVLRILVDIVNRSWPRIQRLSFVILDILFFTYRHIWEQFALPAPYLQHFKVVIDTGHPTGGSYELARELDGWPKEELFAGYAPHLQIFRASRYRFKFSASWLAGLRQVRLGKPFNVEDLLLLLQNTPALVSLHVDSICILECKRALPRVRLSALYKFYLGGIDPHSCTTILENINTPSDCGLSLIMSFGRGDRALKAFFDLISSFTRRYLEHHQARSFQIEYSEEKFFFLANNPSSQAFLEIEFYSLSYKLPSALIRSIYRALAIPELVSVTFLSRMDMVWNVHLEPAVFAPILQQFSSVSHLRLYAIDTLEVLSQLFSDLDAQKDNAGSGVLRSVSSILPSLHTIMLMDWPHWHEESRPMVRKGGTLHKILEIRQKAGCPIKALDLTRCETASRMLPYLDYLEGVAAGLSIFCKLHDAHGKEYILGYKCSSGGLPSSLLHLVKAGDADEIEKHDARDKILKTSRRRAH